LSKTAPPFKRVTAGNLLVAVGLIVVMQLGALAITFQNKPAYDVIVSESGYSADFFGATPAGAFGNAFLLVVFAFAATLALLWVLRKRMVLSFKLLIFASTALAAFILTYVTAGQFADNNSLGSVDYQIAVGAGLVAVCLVGYNLFFARRPWVSTAVLGFIGAEVGSFFAQTLPVSTALVLPVAFSLYDIYAVFRGPLKQLIGTSSGVALAGMSVKLGEFTLGLGDVVFYTMLPSLAFTAVAGPSLAASFSTIVAIDVGVVATLFLLTRKKLLPGLPIPMLLGITTLLAFLLV
jgi:hypothetical protein